MRGSAKIMTEPTYCNRQDTSMHVQKWFTKVSMLTSATAYLPWTDSSGAEWFAQMRTEESRRLLQTKLLLKQKRVAKRTCLLAVQRSEEAKAAFRQGDKQSARASALLSRDAWMTMRPMLNNMRRKQARVGDDVLAAVERYQKGAKEAAVEANLDAFPVRVCGKPRPNALNFVGANGDWMCAEDALFWSSLFQARRERLRQAPAGPARTSW